MIHAISGVHAAVLTPLTAELAPDVAAMARHCRWLLAHGCDGLAVLGTTGEANSFTVDERLALLEGLVEAGLPADTLLPGTGCCAIPDTVRLSRRATELGMRGVLMLPPFYYKNLDDDGLYAAFARTIDAIGDPRLRVLLYHFPQMSGVPIGQAVIGRLLDAYPGVVVGMKDSSGQLESMLSVVKSFPGFAVLTGTDHTLLPLLRAGGAGCITAAANIAAGLARQVCAGWREPAVEEAHQLLSAVRAVFTVPPLVASLKEVMARHGGDPGWRRLRPPLMPLDRETADRVVAQLAATGYRPPAL